MEAGRAIDSTLPVQYEENQGRDEDFVRPNAHLPAWKNREEFIKKLDGSRWLIIRAPTGSGKATIYPALAAQGDSQAIWSYLLYPSKASNNAGCMYWN